MVKCVPDVRFAIGVGRGVPHGGHPAAVLRS